MVVEGANYKQVAKNVRMGKELTVPLGKLWRLMPFRKKVGGKEPGFKSKEVNNSRQTCYE